MVSHCERKIFEYVGIDLHVLGPEEHLLFVQITHSLQEVRPDHLELWIIGVLLDVIDVGLAQIQAVQDEVGLLVVLELFDSDG